MKLKERLYEESRINYDKNVIRQHLEKYNPIEIYVNNFRIPHDGVNIDTALKNIDNILSVGDNEPAVYFIKYNPSFNQPIFEIYTAIENNSFTVSEDDYVPLKEIVLHPPYHKQFEDLEEHKKNLLIEHSKTSVKSMFQILLDGSEVGRVPIDVNGEEIAYPVLTLFIEEYMKLESIPKSYIKKITDDNGVDILVLSIVDNVLQFTVNGKSYDFELGYENIRIHTEESTNTHKQPVNKRAGIWYSKNKEMSVKLVASTYNIKDRILSGIDATPEKEYKTVSDVISAMISRGDKNKIQLRLKINKESPVSIDVRDVGDSKDFENYFISSDAFNAYLKAAIGNIKNNQMYPSIYESYLLDANNKQTSDKVMVKIDNETVQFVIKNKVASLQVTKHALSTFTVHVGDVHEYGNSWSSDDGTFSLIIAYDIKGDKNEESQTKEQNQK